MSKTGSNLLNSTLGYTKLFEGHNNSFKEEFTFEKRKLESEKMLRDHPDRIPIIVERASSSNPDIPYLDKCKFLVHSDTTLGIFMNSVIRKRLKLSKSLGLFIYSGNSLPPIQNTIGTIYNSYKDDDGFLYLTYTGENTFG